MTDILGIGSSGLTAYRKLLEATGNNIANANTEGYARRDVALRSVGEAQMLPTARLGSSGSGVTVDIIRRANDAFLQNQLRTASARQAQAQIMSDGLVRIEKAVIAPANTISTAVQEFYAKAQDLTVTPASTTSRLALIDAGQRVAESFNRAATSVIGEISNADTALTSSIEAVNALAAQIARLNVDINGTGLSQQKMNDLLDQRDVLVKDLSKLINFTTVERASGAIDIYVGNSAGGPKLVDFDSSRMLAITKDGDKRELIFDPYGNAAVTNQVSSGVIAGLLEFQKTGRLFLENLDQLALGFSNSVNIQHRQGLDLNGTPGSDMFSAEQLYAAPFPANRGSAKMLVEIESATQINSSAYTASYSAETGLWTVSSKLTNARVTGKLPMSLEGVRFNVEGTAQDSDSFSVEPLKNASLAMRFVLSDPASIAAGQKIYVDPSYKNTGTATLTVTRTDLPTGNSGLISMADLFPANKTDKAAFARDGIAFAIPAGSNNIILSSLSSISSVVFSTSGSNIASFQTGNDSIRLSVKVGNDTRVLNFKVSDESLQTIATSINNAASEEGLGSDLAAYVVEGQLVLSGLNGQRISEARLGDEAQKYEPFAATDQGGTNPAELILFTREGVQISGPKLSDDEAKRWVTVENGFLSTARYSYRPDQYQGLYRDLPISESEKPLRVLSSSNQQINVEVSADPYLESSYVQSDGAVRAGALYGLDVDGLPPIRLAGSEVAGLDAAAITDKLKEKLDNLATTHFWTGSAFDLEASDKPDLNFRISINGTDDYLVTFQRNRDDNGQLLDTGTFLVDGPKKLNISLIERDDGLQQLSIALPRQLISTDLQIEVTSTMVDDAKTLGLVDAEGNTILNAGLSASSQVSAEVLEAGRFLTLRSGGQKMYALIKGDNHSPVILDRPDVDTGQILGHLEWKLVGGSLLLKSDLKDLSIAADLEAEYNNAAVLGFIGAGLSAERTGSTGLVISSSVNDRVSKLGSVNSVSPIGTRLTIGDVPEDLIVAVRGGDIRNVERTLSVQYPFDAIEKRPDIPDFGIEILSATKLRIVKFGPDGQVVDLYAERDWSPREPVQWMGAEFSIDGDFSVGDRYSITNGEIRSGDNRNALALARLQLAQIFGKNQGTFQDVYSSVATKLGTTSQSATNDAKTAALAESNLQAAFDAKTGVDLDREASDLIRYQQAYQAAAQVVKSARDMFDTILRVF